MKTKNISRVFCAVISLLLTLTALQSCLTDTGARDFASAANNVRNIIAAEIEGKPVLYISDLSESVACYSIDGEKLWDYKLEHRAVIFELLGEDIDGDGSDELLAASGSGHIYCWDTDGKLLWDFTPDQSVRFSEIAVLQLEDQTQVFAAGNDNTLYELDTKGKQLSTTAIRGTVRKLETGYFIDADTPSIFLMTYKHDKYRWNFFGFLDPADKSIQKSIAYEDYTPTSLTALMFNDMQIEDVDLDGRDDILIFASNYAHEKSRDNPSAVVFAINGDFNEVCKFGASTEDTQRYSHVIGTALFPVRDEIVAQYGGIVYILDRKGNLLQKIGENYGPHALNDMCIEPISGTMFAAGDVSGGNGVYAYPLESDTWWMKEREQLGMMLSINNNLDRLYRQALNFSPPPYQKPSDKPWVMVTSYRPSEELKQLKGNKIQFIKQESWSEDFDRSEILAVTGEIGNRRDQRKSYKSSREELIARARMFEEDKQPFIIWSGHGNDPFYVSIETMEGILEAAPETCHGFLYAEMANTKDPRTHYFLENYIPRLIKACRKNGKAKLYFRYKNMFWAATSHISPWKELFFSGKYKDVLVPSTEDTNSRTQDINLAGRVGMFMAGYVDDFSTRLIDDNPTSWRPLAPGGQSSVSPFLRSGVLRASYGSRIGINFNKLFLEDPGMEILYALMASGALPIVSKEDILSVGSWHVVKDPNEEYIHTLDDGHNLDRFTLEDGKAVFSYGQGQWAGINLPDFDYSKIALGVEYRWLNQAPPLPYGMVPIVPEEYKEQLLEENIPFSMSNIKDGYIDGQAVPAKEYGAEISKAVQEGAKRLPVLVAGASWSAIRLDDTHTRIVLIDPGFIEPAERAVSISFQGIIPVAAMDILSKKELEISGSGLQVTVPAGSVRFIDVTYE